MKFGYRILYMYVFTIVVRPSPCVILSKLSIVKLFKSFYLTGTQGGMEGGYIFIIAAP